VAHHTTPTRLGATIPTRRLLVCGVAAAPLFLVVALGQASTREGFDLTRHPISLLSLGDLGWIQITNFVVTGGLYLACAFGMRRALHPGPGSRWGPRLVAAHGLGMIVAGVFLADAGAGYPPGAPAGAPEQLTWHGVLHELGFIAATLAWVAFSIVFARRFAACGRRGWSRVCLGVLAAVLVVSAWPHLESLSTRLLLATALSSGLVAVIAHVVGRDGAGVRPEDGVAMLSQCRTVLTGTPRRPASSEMVRSMTATLVTDVA
jgi:hypothetical protein